MTIRDSWDALVEQRRQRRAVEDAELVRRRREEDEALAVRRREEDACDARMESMVAWVTSLSRVAAGVPPEEITPPIVPTVPATREADSTSAGAPAVGSPAGSVGTGLVYTPRIRSTIWRNRADERPGGDPPEMNSGITAMPGDGLTKSWVSLPVQVGSTVRRLVYQRLNDGSGVVYPAVGPRVQVETGPWWDGTRGTPGSFSPDLEDEWWDGAPARRPKVEILERDARGRVDNGAGIDNTPRLAAEIHKAAGKYPELTVDQLAERFYLNPIEFYVDVAVVEEPIGHDGPSPHFTWVEVSRSATADERGIDNAVPADLRPGVIEFALGIVEPLRAALGRKMKHGRDWTSWYRCPPLNAVLGGSETSGHLTGRGLDVPRTEEFWRAIRAAKVTIPFHVNVEPDHYDLKVGDAPGAVAVAWIRGAVATPWEV